MLQAGWRGLSRSSQLSEVSDKGNCERQGSDRGKAANCRVSDGFRQSGKYGKSVEGCGLRWPPPALIPAMPVLEIG